MSRFPGGIKYVMRDTRTGEYLKYDCRGTTRVRAYAWAGTLGQSSRARETFSISDRFEVVLDDD